MPYSLITDKIDYAIEKKLEIAKLADLSGNPTWNQIINNLESAKNKLVFLGTNEFESFSFTGASPNGYYVWRTANNIYYTFGGITYILDVDTHTWTEHSFSGTFVPYYGSQIWFWENKAYYSNGVSQQYVFDEANNTWVAKTWNITIQPYYLWNDGTNLYMSSGSANYVLSDEDTGTWETITWTTTPSPLYGSDIWNWKGKTYYSNNSLQYELVNGNWVAKSWGSSGLTSVNGESVWNDGNVVYCASTNAKHYLDEDSNTWKIKTWTGLTNFSNNDIWTDGVDYYYNGTYRLNKPKTWSEVITEINKLANI